MRPTSSARSPPTTSATTAARVPGSTSAPYLKRDKIEPRSFPAATRYYTQYKGKRCALPLLADAYGLYYNKTMLQEGRDHEPAEDDLGADRRREEADRSATRTARSRSPASTRSSASTRTSPERWSQPFGAQVARQERASRSSPRTRAGRSMLKWQKSLIDWYGYKNLVKFQAGAGDEFSASHAFETGKLAMNMDGEWRVAFIQDEHPELKYGTAPMPGRRRPARRCTARATSTGTIIGIPKSGEAPGPGVGAGQVPDDERPRAGAALERDPRTSRRRRRRCTRRS